MKEDENEVVGCGCSCESCHGCSPEEVENDEFESGILTFVDEDGKDVQFEILDVVTVDEKEYLVVMPTEENGSEESGVLVLEIKQEDGEEVYDTVTDEAEAEKVFNIFQEQYGYDDEEDEESEESDDEE